MLLTPKYGFYASLTNRFALQVAVHLWATGGGALSSCSFLLLHDVASFLDQDCYDRCLKKTYTTILSRSKVVDPTCLKHIEYLKNSFIELCSIDLLRSIQLAMMSTQKLARIFQLGLQTKKKVHDGVDVIMASVLAATVSFLRCLTTLGVFNC